MELAEQDSEDGQAFLVRLIGIAEVQPDQEVDQRCKGGDPQSEHEGCPSACAAALVALSGVPGLPVPLFTRGTHDTFVAFGAVL